MRVIRGSMQVAAGNWKGPRSTELQNSKQYTLRVYSNAYFEPGGTVADPSANLTSPVALSGRADSNNYEDV